MARLARIVVPRAWHHVTQRGNNKQDVFFVEDDRRVYLELLRQQGARYGFRVEGFCLMTNHVHLIGVPEREESARELARVAKAVGRTHFLYTQYVNRMGGRGVAGLGRLARGDARPAVACDAQKGRRRRGITRRHPPQHLHGPPPRHGPFPEQGGIPLRPPHLAITRGPSKRLAQEIRE